MTQHRPSRRTILAGAAASSALLAAPGLIQAQGLDRLSYHTGWRAQAEQGGFHQALATGLYREHGLDVEIRQGGPQVDLNAQLLAGRVDVIESNSFAVFNYVRENLPGVAFAAFMQKDPRILLSHRDAGNDRLEDLRGKPVLLATSGRQTFWQWLKARYGFTDEQVRPYTFNLAPFLADRRLSQQGLLTSEPFDVRTAGVDPVVHLIADHGFAAYQSVALASPRLVAEKADVLQRFVDASIKGWRSYLTGDPSPGNALIKRDNPDMSDAKIAFAIEAMNRNGIVVSGDAEQGGVGAMTDARWRSFYEAMVAAGAQPAGLDVSKGYTLRFVNKGVGARG